MKRWIWLLAVTAAVICGVVGVARHLGGALGRFGLPRWRIKQPLLFGGLR